MKKSKLFLSICLSALAYSSSVFAGAYCQSTENLRANALDIPQDSLLMLQITKGRIPDEMKQNSQLVYDTIQKIFRKKFSQKETPEGHKPNTQLLIQNMTTSLKCESIDSLRHEFMDGVYKNVKLYTDETPNLPGKKIQQNYQAINNALREDSNLQNVKLKNPQVAQMIQSIDASINILPSVRGVVYRGTSLTTEMLKKIIETRLYSDSAYLSSSVDVVDAYNFLMSRRNIDGHQKVMMVIYSKTGKFIPFGKFSREEEVLFKRGATFKLQYQFEHIDEDNTNNNTVYLFLEQTS